MIAGRTIIALLVAITVLEIVSTTIPHTSASSTSTFGTDNWGEIAHGGNLHIGTNSGSLTPNAHSLTNDTTKPIAMAGPDRMSRVGHEITLNARASTDNIGIVNYTWSFVAGPMNGTLHRLYGPVVNIAFAEAREYRVILSVTDAAGNVSYDEMVVTVEDTRSVISVLGNDGALLALGVVLVLVAVLVMDSLIRRIRKNDSRPSVPQEPPPPKT